jgi:AraC-like DNA-binding protein|tara:strand:+ start:1749 stop:2897 length:1149 start_codon:yes stop_codon:yes gene_type:complete
MFPETLYYIGISQALFVSLVLFTKANKQGSDFVLMAWLLTISFKMMILLISAEHGEFFDNQFSIGLIPLTFGPFLFLYTKNLLYRRWFFKSRDFLHYTPFIFFTFLYFTFFKGKLSFDNHMFFLDDGYLWVRLMYSIAFMISVSYYTFLTLKILGRHRKQLKDRFSFLSESNELNWLYVLTAIFGVTYFLYFSLGTYNVLMKKGFFDIAYTSDVFLTILAFSVSYFGIKQPYLFKVIPEENEEFMALKKKNESKRKYKNSNLTEEQKEEYVKHIFTFMDEERPFINAELTVQDLSKQLNISRHHLTELLNNDIGKNFFTFINEYRVEEVKRRLLDARFEHLTIVAIAFESGFNSKSTFNSIFKQNTGNTPSQWKTAELKIQN